MPTARPIRRTLDGLSPYDTEAVQRWAIQRVTDEVVRSATFRRTTFTSDDPITRAGRPVLRPSLTGHGHPR